MAELPVETLRRQYHDYLDSKRAEIDEQREARRYYHADQWTRAELKTLKKRNQPPVTSNLIARKVNGIVGLIERLRQDPKAYARTPQHEQGAELATACLRYVLDNNEWGALSPESARHGAIDGIGGLELGLEQGDNGDIDVTLAVAEPDTFFYDPCSFRPDFSDVRYMGVAKWVGIDLAKEIFPDKAEQLDGMMTGDYAMAAGDQDRERKWIDTGRKRLRLVEHWYISGGVWYWCFHVGLEKLDGGVSPFPDEKGKPACKYIMYSAYVDHEGDRYGFIRNMKSPQDEVNHHKSKAIHILSSRKVIAEAGAVDDVNAAKAEWAKADGWIVKNRGFELEQENREVDFQGQMLFLEKAEREISTLAPDPASLVGEGSAKLAQSGRAIALLQQAGMAELGPFILAYRNWKIRVYRAIWYAIKKHWTAERYIRVTDNDDMAQYVQINGFQIDPERGPVMVNALGVLDVDIILDEGPDTINMMQDAFDALVQSGMQVPPDIWLELAPIQSSVKKRLLEKLQQASQQDPMQQQAMMAQLQELMAKIDKLRSESMLNMARAQDIGTPDMPSPQSYEPPPELQDAKMMADIDSSQAKAEQSRAAAFKTQREAGLAPFKLIQDAQKQAAPVQ